MKLLLKDLMDLARNRTTSLRRNRRRINTLCLILDRDQMFDDAPVFEDDTVSRMYGFEGQGSTSYPISSHAHCLADGQSVPYRKHVDTVRNKLMHVAHYLEEMEDEDTESFNHRLYSSYLLSLLRGHALSEFITDAAVLKDFEACYFRGWYVREYTIADSLMSDSAYNTVTYSYSDELLGQATSKRSQELLPEERRETIRQYDHIYGQGHMDRLIHLPEDNKWLELGFWYDRTFCCKPPTQQQRTNALRLLAIFETDRTVFE